MRVLVVSHLYPYPGVDRHLFVHEQCLALRALGVDMRVISPTPCDPARPLVEQPDAAARAANRRGPCATASSPTTRASRSRRVASSSTASATSPTGACAACRPCTGDALRPHPRPPGAAGRRRRRAPEPRPRRAVRRDRTRRRREPRPRAVRRRSRGAPLRSSRGRRRSSPCPAYSPAASTARVPLDNVHVVQNGVPVDLPRCAAGRLPARPPRRARRRSPRRGQGPRARARGAGAARRRPRRPPRRRSPARAPCGGGSKTSPPSSASPDRVALPRPPRARATSSR